MDAAYISALAALAGTANGGLTSFATSWMMQHSPARAEVRRSWVDQHIDPLRDFSEACREELQRFGNF